MPRQGESRPHSDGEVAEELERILASPQFANAGRISRFLRFVVERTLAGDRESLKESVIGAEVFDRGIGYDPRSEPIVRTEARRLRAKLDKYYQTSGRDTAIRIAVPTGGYVAVFLPGKPAALPKLAVMPKPDPVEEPGSAEAGSGKVPQTSHRFKWRLALALLAVTAVAIGWWRLGGHLGRRTEYGLTTITSYPGGQYSPALSPDGRQVAFSWSAEPALHKDIYVVAADGGTPRRITTGHADDDMPSWSPDGSQLAFIRHARSLMTVSLAGGGERTLAAAYPRFVNWSRKSNLILFSDWVPDHNRLAIFAIEPVSGAKRQLTVPAEKSNGDSLAAASPDGSQYAFLRCTLGNCDIYAMPMAGGRARRITHDDCAFSGLTWMPDGHSIVYSNQRRGPYMLWRIDDSGAGDPEPIPASADEARFPMAARGPSGRTRIVFEQRLRNSNIWRQQLNADRAKSGAALPERLIASTRVDSSPQISPDGRRIVFASDRSGYDEIWIADADGANQKALTNMRVHLTGSPRWSPDSRRIAFDALSKKGRALFLIDSAGGEPRQWTPWGDEARPSWSRDGRWIYYGASDSAAKLQVWKISTADRAVQQVTRDGGFEAYESLDGRTLYYNSGVELRRMPVEGGNWTRVSDTPINKGWWSVSAGGIYFTGFPPLSPPPNGPFPVFFLDPISGSVRQVTSIDGPLTRSNPDFTVSADGTTLLYSRPEILTSQIRMLEVQP